MVKIRQQPNDAGPGLTRAAHWRLGRVTGLILTGCLSGMLGGCHSAKLPDKSSPQYREIVSSFYVGLAALQVGDDVHAESKLSEVTELAPGEPAGWANWGVLALRQRNYGAASERFERALKLAPENDQVYDLLGILESERGNSAQAIADLRKATELNPQNLRAIYQLAEETERQGAATSESDFQEQMQRILAAQPNNLAALSAAMPTLCAGRWIR
jgi:Flp pilus assembly protein TadD